MLPNGRRRWSGRLIVAAGGGAAGAWRCRRARRFLLGRQQFLLDLYSAVEAQVKAGKVPTGKTVVLPERDKNWVPADLVWDVEATYNGDLAGEAGGGSAA